MCENCKVAYEEMEKKYSELETKYNNLKKAYEALELELSAAKGSCISSIGFNQSESYE